MTDGHGLLQAIIDTPDDEGLRLVYADWLEEQGETDQAELIRVQCRLGHWTDEIERRFLSRGPPLDRRAPLAMRIEVSPEPAAPAARGSSAGSGSARVRAGASSGGSGRARSAAAEPLAVAADEPESQIVAPAGRPIGWVIVAVLIAIGVAAMVIMTLK